MHTHESLKALVRDHLVRKIALNYDPPPRIADSADAQREQIEELCRDAIEMLPTKETAESLGLILDNAWKALRQTYTFARWPKVPVVLDHVRDAVASFVSRTGANRPAYGGPVKPAMTLAGFYRRRALQWPEGSALREYYDGLARKAHDAWEAYLGQGGQLPKEMKAVW